MNTRLLPMLLAAVAVCLFISCSETEVQTAAPPLYRTDTIALSQSYIDCEIKKQLDQGRIFDWSKASDQLVWSAGSQGYFLFTIGFGKKAGDVDRSLVPDHQQLQNQLLALLVEMEGRPVQEILLQSENNLTQIDVFIKKQTTVSALRRLPYVRYLEPAAYIYPQQQVSTVQAEAAQATGSGSGCGFEINPLATADFTTITPGARMPWNFSSMQIPAAWSLSTGSGVAIGVIDTGVSSEQALLGSSFADGLSVNRMIQKYGFYVNSFFPWTTTNDGPDDSCGHGTSMVSAMAAPRNNNGRPVGVAYNCNLVSCRASSDVLLNSYHEQNGVKNAFVFLSHHPSVRIISMSMGHVISVGKISDAVKYAYARDRLIVSAAGTSTNYTNFVGVIFPATMDEVVAVTGVKEGASYQACSVCHSGSKVAFTVPMQRSISGNTIPVNSYYNNADDYVGGSSVATATVAGIAALVWSRYPYWNRAQLMNRLRMSATFYPVKHPAFGHGNINALAAVQ